MKRNILWPMLILAAVALALSPSVAAADEGNAGNPGIMPPNSTPSDMSYAQWHVAWWNWAVSMPQATSPLLNADDPEDQQTALWPVWIGPYDASAGQSGHAWFLAETFAFGWAVERDAVIPAGKSLCFPLQNHMMWGWPDIPEAEAWMRFYLGLVLDTAVVTCEIDGAAVNHLERYRCQSPAVPMVLGDNNFIGVPPGQYGMMVDDGYYLILAPLSVGTHTIHWKASMELITYWNPWDPVPPGPYPSGVQEVTYHIMVVPHK